MGHYAFNDLPSKRSGLDLLDHVRVEQGGNIAQIIRILGGDLSEDPSHDLARPGLGQAADKLDLVQFGDGAHRRGDELIDLHLEHLIRL